MKEVSLSELKEQLKILTQEQIETENAYWENQGMKDKSILAGWAQEILEREERINNIKKRISQVEQETGENPLEESEETHLVDVQEMATWKWLRQELHVRKMAFQENILKGAPGLSEEDLRGLRERKIAHYQEMLAAYYTEKETDKEEKKAWWDITPEQKRVIIENQKNNTVNQADKMEKKNVVHRDEGRE